MDAENDDALWNRAKELLRHHQKSDDPTPVDALNRLLHEAAPEASSIRLSEANCRIVLESWLMKKLAGLRRRHDRATPKDEGCPILVVCWRGKQYLIDGGNRINKWVKEKNEGSHAVLVMMLAEEST
ncbi:MAG TPA: hypothetical protein VGJ05_15360 [Fimbriiglobus sp.]|jgi:hypothetical protein